MTEAELKKHLDAAEKSPKQIAAAVAAFQTALDNVGLMVAALTGKI